MGLLFVQKIAISQHIRRKEYSLKMNVFFYLKAENVVFKPVELNLVHRFVIFAMVHKPSSVKHDIWIFLV